MANEAWDRYTDVLVVGSGGGALTSAIVAADAGAKVMVIEKSALFGGSTATSGGVVWIPNSNLADPAVHQDSAAEALSYIGSLTEGLVPQEQMRAFVENAPTMLDYVTKATDVRYVSIAYTDYHAELPGGKLGYRSHMPLPLDGRALGDDLEHLRRNHPSSMLFGKISWTAEEAGPLLARSKGWWRILLRLLSRYYLDIGQRLRSPRDRFLVGGNALIARLKMSLDKRGITIERNARLVELIRDGEIVTGAVVEIGGKLFKVKASKAVILGAGGFERNPDLRAQNLTRSTNPDWSGGQSNNTGDALTAALAVGAKAIRLDSAWWAPTIRVPGHESAWPLFFERSLPGSIIINAVGRRYVNEAASYHVVGRQMMERNLPEAPTSPSWILFDARFRWRYPMGPLMPMIPNWMHSAAVRDIVVRTNSWDDMADRLKIDRGVLRETVDHFNHHAQQGKDPDFHRGDNPYDRYYGDPKVRPNPNLLPLERAPFYALPIYPGDIGTNGGLATNGNAQVMDTDGCAIVGLYAIGNTSASVMGPSYPGAGATIGPAMTFGYLAARHAMGIDR
ncbi:FAD-dependent oxidoreductase [Sphingosinicella soli]|uniref:3-oxosteroid 1-dehydrogenase n=1 Tax=Sphingosinicella soli TaxID=333708 RepID=A0A7W7B286_9SPHN|nr:FAD-dependent oxidoreductase [Sphingosinicella soli]MBB4632680.1 3-oxosteroid 1-dehydrogenase [Sphingosinicella soli]